MKLLSQKSREYKGKNYIKYWVVIANEIIKKLGWKKGELLKAKINNNKLIIQKEK